MRLTPVTIAAVLLCLPWLQGCSKTPAADTPESAAKTSSIVTAGNATAVSPQSAKACDLVTAQEMSDILGKPVTAQGEERPSNDETTCSYTFAGSLSPDVTFMLNRGAGEAAMTGMGMLSQHEPGIVDPYEGLGDQAATVGSQLWIRTGDDLVTLTILGVDDVPAVAKRIVDTAKARM